MYPYCEHSPGHPFHGPYHEREYGFPVESDDILFERLALEINQAGLSWLTVLKKREAFQEAFDHFAIEKVAQYDDTKRQQLLTNAAIIRNRLKINAVIHNANVLLNLKESHGSFKGWLDAHHPRALPEWVKLFKKTFKFTGPEIVNEFLMSTGYLPGAHSEDCPVYSRVMKQQPAWYSES